MKVDVLKELRTMRTRFVNCVMHNGSDREFAEAACESFDAAMAEVAALLESERSFVNSRIAYRGFSYGTSSQWGIDSLRYAINRNGDS